MIGIGQSRDHRGLFGDRLGMPQQPLAGRGGDQTIRPTIEERARQTPLEPVEPAQDRRAVNPQSACRGRKRARLPNSQTSAQVFPVKVLLHLRSDCCDLVM